MILVSAGHNPSRKGAHFGNFYEHDEAVLWRDKIIKSLGRYGVSVPTGSLEEKVGFINNNDPTLAIEIHFNAAPGGYNVNSKKWSGSLTLYNPGSKSGKILATEVQSGLDDIFGKHWHGVMEGWYKMDKESGVKDYFLNKTSCPAIIVEPEFIHHEDIIINNRDEACAHITYSLMYMYEQFGGQ